MAYDYKPRQIDTWEFAAQSAVYREKWLHQQQETAYWKARALAGATVGSEVAA